MPFFKQKVDIDIQHEENNFMYLYITLLLIWLTMKYIPKMISYLAGSLFFVSLGIFSLFESFHVPVQLCELYRDKQKPANRYDVMPLTDS